MKVRDYGTNVCYQENEKTLGRIYAVSHDDQQIFKEHKIILNCFKEFEGENEHYDNLVECMFKCADLIYRPSAPKPKKEKKKK